jgi:hypothetical protein
MVMDIVHKIKYIIEFKNPVDYFDVILQKQIDLRLEFDGNENCITIFDFDSRNKRLRDTNFFSNYEDIFSNYNVIGQTSYYKLYEDPDKYSKLKYIYERIEKDISHWTPKILLSSEDNNLVVSYEEFEFNIDIMLEEFKLFCKFFEFNEDEKKIISSIVEDPNLKSNIKFIGLIDYWITC